MARTPSAIGRGVTHARRPERLFRLAFLVLALAIAFGLAGCFGSDEAPEREPITGALPPPSSWKG